MERSVCLAIIQKKKLLVEKKGNFWDLPGRKLKADELETEFIFNEIRKEIPGLNLENLEPYGFFNGKILLRWDPLKSKIYLLKLKANQIIKLGNPELRKIKWISNLNGCKLSRTVKIVFRLLKDEGYL